MTDMIYEYIGVGKFQFQFFNMAYLHNLRNFSKLSQARRAARSMPAGSSGKSTLTCGGEEPPACEPCVPATRRPCRAAPPPLAPALRVTCCALPQRPPPPCPRKLPPCPHTCQMLINQIVPSPPKCDHKIPKLECDDRCGSGQDYVALRLAAADRERRRSYEEEVRAPKKTCSAESTKMQYEVKADRACFRATDGKKYTFPAFPNEDNMARCEPGGVPPPPKAIQLDRDTTCRPREPPYVDPCANKPRIILQVDRSSSRNTKHPRSAESNPNCSLSEKNQIPNTSVKPDSPQATSTSTRTSTQKSNDVNKTKCLSAGTGSKSAPKGHPDWCKSLPPPVEGPYHCRPASVVEQIKRRTSDSQHQCHFKRDLHTLAPFACSKSILAKEKNISNITQYRVGEDDTALATMISQMPVLIGSCDGIINSALVNFGPKKCGQTPGNRISLEDIKKNLKAIYEKIKKETPKCYNQNVQSKVEPKSSLPGICSGKEKKK